MLGELLEKSRHTKLPMMPSGRRSGNSYFFPFLLPVLLFSLLNGKLGFSLVCFNLSLKSIDLCFNLSLLSFSFHLFCFFDNLLRGFLLGFSFLFIFPSFLFSSFFLLFSFSLFFFSCRFSFLLFFFLFLFLLGGYPSCLFFSGNLLLGLFLALRGLILLKCFITC